MSCSQQYCHLEQSRSIFYVVIFVVDHILGDVIQHVILMAIRVIYRDIAIQVPISSRKETWIRIRVIYFSTFNRERAFQVKGDHLVLAVARIVLIH